MILVFVIQIFMDKNKRPLISIIVANYNNDKYIEECLDSILAQTYKKLEIIVYDDASDDDSVEIIKRFEKNSPGVVKGLFGKRNRGVAEARHLAIMTAEGDYLTTLDSDDYYYDTKKLEKEMELVQFYKDEMKKDIIAFSNIVLVNCDKSLIKTVGKFKKIKEGMILNEILARSCMIPRDFIMKKEAYFEIRGFDKRFPIYEDWDLKINLANRYDFYYTGISGTAYRRHGSGLSDCPISEHVKWLKRIFRKNLKLVDNNAKKNIKIDFKKFINTIKVKQ